MEANQIPASLEEIDQDWLETVLNDGRPLPPFTMQPLAAQNSNTARLVFSKAAPNQQIPRSCVLKLCPTGHAFLGASEPNYYSRDYIGLSEAPIPNCYRTIGAARATADSTGDGYVLILEDLTADHTDHMHMEPVEAHAARLGHALGQLHAHRWGRNADPEGPHDLKADFDRFISHVSKGTAPILDAMGALLDAPSRARISAVFETDADRMVSRALSGKGLALVHGDPNPTNILTPKTPGHTSQPLFLIDRQPFPWSLRLWLGASDLVYAAVPFWPETHRRALSKTLLCSYHRALLANGVQGYSWDDLLEDWRACACMALFTALEWGADASALTDMRWLWERQLGRALDFLEDCAAEGAAARNRI